VLSRVLLVVAESLLVVFRFEFLPTDEGVVLQQTARNAEYIYISA
jgi:hypothetical protein